VEVEAVSTAAAVAVAAVSTAVAVAASIQLLSAVAVVDFAAPWEAAADSGQPQSVVML
jgi:hypothetical protein